VSRAGPPGSYLSIDCSFSLRYNVSRIHRRGGGRRRRRSRPIYRCTTINCNERHKTICRKATHFISFGNLRLSQVQVSSIIAPVAVTVGEAKQLCLNCQNATSRTEMSIHVLISQLILHVESLGHLPLQQGRNSAICNSILAGNHRNFTNFQHPNPSVLGTKINLLSLVPVC